jgi:hypothetical protein
MATKQQSTPSEISFKLVNNTNSNILMSFLSNPSNLQDISNQFTEYSWNITSIAGNLSTYDTIILTFGNGSSVTTTIQQKTLDGIIIALNQLGVSSFYYDIVGGSTYIKTYNDVQLFTTLEIVSSTAVVGVQLFYSINTPFSTTGNSQIDNFGAFNTGVLGNPQSIPTTNATSFITLGDNIEVTGQNPLIGVDINIGIRVLVEETIGLTTTTISDQISYGGLYPSTIFPLANNNASYNISVLYPTLDANYYVETTSTSGNVSIDYGQGSVPIWLNPTNQQADFTTSVSAGQLVQVYGVAPNTGSILTTRVKISQQNLTTGVITILSNNLYSSGASFNDSFTIANGFAYQIIVGDI